jgi:carbonic anhydrase
MFSLAMSDDAYRQVFENNRRWAAAKRATNAEFFENLEHGQTPGFLYVGCSDSRVPANEVMGLPPGEVFVHRNVANLVVNTDMNVQSVIHYGVGVLKVRHVVVCGHYGCGGVQAAMQSADLGVLNGWLREVRDVYRLHATELDGIADLEARYRRLVEINVHEQCFNIIKTPIVQQCYEARGFPRVYGWVYDLHDGHLNDLEIPFDRLLDEVRKLYDV